MAQEMVTYSDIISAVRETLGIQSSDTNATNKIKRMINEYYLDEVVPFKNWMWLQKNIQVIHAASYVTGTVAVTNGSATATLSTSPPAGSLKGYRFSVASSNQVYTVSAHTSLSTTVTLSTAFQEDTDAAATFKLWRDRFDLPTEARETVEIWHSQLQVPLNGVGSQGFRALEAKEPKAEGFPTHYNTYDFNDPSSGDDEYESDRYRQTRIWPSINEDNVILNVDYIQEVVSLEDDVDEPLMPIGDRVVLFYGACARAYSAINRNEEMHDKYMMRANAKLSRMAANREEGQDTPKLAPVAGYVNHIRRARARRARSW